MTKPAVNLETPAELNQIVNKTIQILADIEAFKIDQQKNAKAQETWENRVRALKQLSTLTDLTDPEAVKLWLSDKEKCKWANTTKIKVVDSYTQFLLFKKITWKPPTYTKIEKLPFIPTEQEIDLLISGCGKITSTVLQMLKETGMRIGELCQLKWIDLDRERRTINITPEKGSNPRILPLSDKLLNMINQLPRQHAPFIFQPQKRMLREYFDIQRKELSEHLQNPRLLQITFHTFRHWKGTMEYHKTKDIMHVKYVLGHKSVKSTEIYINLEAALWLSSGDEWNCLVVHNEQELVKAVEGNWALVTALNNSFPMFFKKRK